VPLTDPARLSATGTAKAARILVTYRPDLRRQITLDWQRELVPALHIGATSQLRRIFSPVRFGDVIQIDYTEPKGTTVRINRDVAVSRASHDLMLAFLDHWLGQRPVSEDMKRQLLSR
jgi:hypothetical protein